MAETSASDQLIGTAMRIYSPIHVGLYRLTHGRVGNSIGGDPVLLLTTLGRKSGKLRTTPLMYFRDGDKYIICASRGGHDTPPSWWYNLQDNPHARVEIGSQRFMTLAHEAEGEERERLWSQIVKEQPQFARYQDRTDRRIPVVVLTPKQPR